VEKSLSPEALSIVADEWRDVVPTAWAPLAKQLRVLSAIV
jgi:hypothetical protein